MPKRSDFGASTAGRSPGADEADQKGKINMKKQKIAIILLCTVSFIAGALVSQPSQVRKMENALATVINYEADENGIYLYTYDGNVYRLNK